MSQRFLLSIVALLISSFFLFGCESNPKWEDFQGGIHLVLEVESRGNSYIDQENATIIRDILAERAKQFGIKKKIIKIDGERNIIIQLPKSANHERVIDLLGKSHFLEFKFVDDESSIEEVLKGKIPDDREILYQSTIDPKTKSNKETPYLVYKKASLSGKYINKAKVELDRLSNPAVQISFNKEGSQIFQNITRENIGKRLAIIFEGMVYSAPTIQGVIPSGMAQITGNFTMEEANDLAVVLNSGSYPVPVKIIKQDELTKELWM